MRFRDRRDAGRQLAARLEPLRAERPIVLGVARGGVAVASEVARALDAPLDVVVVRKVGHPGHREVAVGALAEGGVSLVDPVALWDYGIDADALEEVVQEEEAELERRVARYRGGRRLAVEGRTVLVVDDGIATGSTAEAAVEAVARAGAGRVVLAVPVASPSAVETLRRIVSDVVCLAVPPDLGSVGEWYLDFAPVDDVDVLRHLERSAPPGPAGPLPPCGTEVEVRVDVDGRWLPGWLDVPPAARGLVVFAHGRGSGRDSPRNVFVAHRLNDAGLATLLVDLLGPDEAGEPTPGFDTELLSARLVAVTRWCGEHGLPSRLALFGASTGAAAALAAAAHLGSGVAAVVSRGGRPDLAGRALPDVVAPTLLLVGGADTGVLALNRAAATRLTGCDHELVVVPGATHLFEERGALEAVADLATWWITSHLGPDPLRIP